MAIEQSPAALVAMFKALADESRLKIIGLLATRERSVAELATTLRLKPPTVSHHLSTLRDLGLVAMRQEGTTHVYRFRPETLRRLNRSLAPHRLAIPDDAGGGDWDRKVLGDFLDQGRLRSIPAGERKRLVILRWLAGKFAPGRQFSEKEVNVVLAGFHNDHASLRRHLVDHGLLARRAGVYWRVEPAEINVPQSAPPRA